MAQAYPFSADFPINDLLLPYKGQLINEYYQALKDSDGSGYSKRVQIQAVLDIIKPAWIDIINYHFNPIDTSYPDFEVWLYSQNNTNNRSVWHNHPEAELNTVFYLDIPKEGGELQMLNVDPSINKFKEEKIKVENNKLYIMPFWWYHRPLSQKDSNERLCFNIQYHSKDRIRLKQRNGKSW
jgi:hypothetical protein